MILVFKLECFIPPTTENLETENAIKRQTNAEWAITIVLRESRKEVHRKMSKESFREFKRWYKRPSTNRLEGFLLLWPARKRSWLGWCKECLPQGIRIPTPGLSLVPFLVLPCLSPTVTKIDCFHLKSLFF